MNHTPKVLLGLFFSFLILLSFGVSPIRAAESLDVHFFYSETCPHCQEELVYLAELETTYPDLVVHRYEVTDYSDLFDDVMTMLGSAPYPVPRQTPLTVLGGVAIPGFNEQNKDDLVRLIERYLDTPPVDIVQKVIDGIPVQAADFDTLAYQPGDRIWIPLLGKVPIESISLGLGAFFIGLVDGFNPCAMWILLLLISLLANQKDRKRMWILGSAFLFTSALVYFLVMMAWLQVALTVSALAWVRIVIGLLAIGFGGFSLFRFVKKAKTPEIGCDVTDATKKKKTIEKIKQILAERSLWIALAGIILLAISVNALELACSAGLPLLYANILAFNGITGLASIGFVGLYVFFFLLDDLVVFAMAMITLRVTGITNKYARFSHLAGGLIMIALGILLLFFPQILLFNF